MSKFRKRVQKSSRYHENSMVVGTGFGHLEEILEIYKNIFVISDIQPTIKSKKLIYRRTFNNLNSMPEVNVIFFDIETVHLLSEFKFLWQKYNSVIIIEGAEPIEREFSKPLYDSGWGCTNLQTTFHVWEKIK